MPFIADYLYHKLSDTTLEDSDSVMVMEFPKAFEKDETIEQMFEIIEEAIVGIRRAKVTIDMGNSKIEKAYIKLNSEIDKEMAKPFIQKVAKVQSVEFVDSKVEDSITDVSDNLEIYLPTDKIDLSAITSKLQTQKAKVLKEVEKLEKMLGNEKFVQNAPKEVVKQNQKALNSAKEKLEKIENELKALS
jgi:valyl-tRNA synthetase